MTFVKGQPVHVEFDGTVSRQLHEYGVEIQVEIQSADDAYMTINVRYITPLDPENWPPQVGDIWEADGKEYVAHANAIDPTSVVVCPIERSSSIGPWWDDKGPQADGSLFGNFKALGPTLVRRRNR